MRMNKLIGLMFVVYLFSAGCGLNDEVTTHIVEGSATGPMSVNVSDGNTLSQPIYTWSDGGPTLATKVTVSRASDTATAVWEVYSTATLDDISSPVTHGTVPTTGSSTAIASPEINLQDNIWYEVKITKLDVTKTSTRQFLIEP